MIIPVWGVSCGLRCVMNFKRFGWLVGLSLISHQAWSSCDLVKHLAGEAYQTAPNYAASIDKQPDLDAIAQVGIWFIYTHPNHQAWFNTCAPIQRSQSTFYPVLQTADQFAVINGLFLIKTHREQDIHLLEKRYGFKLVSALPNRFSAVFDVNPVADYDALIKRLDRDKDIERVAPVLIEAPRQR